MSCYEDRIDVVKDTIERVTPRQTRENGAGAVCQQWRDIRITMTILPTPSGALSNVHAWYDTVLRKKASCCAYNHQTKPKIPVPCTHSNSRPRHTHMICSSNLSKKHTTRILNVLLDLDQESSSLSSINETVVIGKSDVHHLVHVSKRSKRGKRQNSQVGSQSCHQPAWHG